MADGARRLSGGEALVAARSFVVFFRSGLSASRTYLLDCLVGLITYPAELALAFLMWRLFLTAGAGSMSGQDVLAYYALLLLVGRLGPSRFVSLRLETEVVTGGLAVFMVRPVSPWAAIAGRELAPAFINFLVLTPIAALVVGLVLGRMPHLLAFTAWMMLAILLRTLMRLIVGTASFWMLRIVGLVHAVEFVTGICSGAVLPLSIFPLSVQVGLDATPFPLLTYVPIRAMTGALPASEVPRLAATGLIWVVALAAIFRVMWGRGSRKFLGHGI